MSRHAVRVFMSVVFCLVALSAYAQEYNFPELVQTEAHYILLCQYNDAQSPAYGAINNIPGSPSWVVPRENAMAILGLVMASSILGDNSYIEKAKLSADYLVRVQDKDGAWYNRYTFALGGSGNSEDKDALAKSPTQTAEAMIALYTVGFTPQLYPAMKKGAKYLVACQKKGGDGFLLGSGKGADGNFRSWRWASDNAYAYQALKAAEVWALQQQDYHFALACANASRKVLQGINTTLYIKNPFDPDYGVWYRVVDEKNEPVDPTHHDWINYAPQMLNVPCRGADASKIGKWIHTMFQQADYGCVWDDYEHITRKSPGYTFQAVLCWRRLGQAQWYVPALTWGLESGLWQVDPDENGISGGWTDWAEAGGPRADWWNRFIGTSFYAIAAYNGGYDFSIVPSFLRIGYSNPKAAEQAIPFYLKLKFDFPEDLE